MTLWRGPYVYELDDTGCPNINADPPSFRTLMVASFDGRNTAMLQDAPHTQFQLEAV